MRPTRKTEDAIEVVCRIFDEFLHNVPSDNNMAWYADNLIEHLAEHLIEIDHDRICPSWLNLLISRECNVEFEIVETVIQVTDLPLARLEIRL